MPPHHPTVYLIRHGEKPPKKPDGDDQDGLSKQGLDRSQLLVQVFGKSSSYNIGFIIAQKPKDDGGEDRPYLTVKLLAESLGSEVPFNHSIKRDDADKVAKAVHEHKGPGNILICWEHKHLTNVAGALGIAQPPTYPGNRFDLIWTVPHPYNQITNVTSEQCQPMDDPYKAQVWTETNGQWNVVGQ